MKLLDCHCHELSQKRPTGNFVVGELGNGDGGNPVQRQRCACCSGKENLR